MKFSEKWLREWVSPAISTDELVEQITMAGLEVDGVEPVAGKFTNVVVGEVVECGQHPDADKLKVTKINVGEEEFIDIVCGAPNCRQGLKVAVAKVGAVLPGNFKIKKAKLRGQPSLGMLCSASELELSDESDGILELPQDAPIGQDVRQYLELDDVSIEVDLTPNRSDCLGIKGLAREVGVLNQTDVNTLPIEPAAPSIDDKKDIVLDSPQACPRYLGRIIRNVDLSAISPLWLTEKLRRCGVRSIDPVVDVTNYVLLELGHPMHAFDLDKIDGEVRVRFAADKEKLTLLDGNEVDLKPNTLVIADSSKPMCIAGVFGGIDSGVTKETNDIFLESAFFTPDAIQGVARQYGLHTDASHRYERGVDPALQAYAMDRATSLLLDIVGGEAGPVVEAVNDEHIPMSKSISLRHQRITKVLGVEISPTHIEDILNRLGFDIASAEGSWLVTVPAYRFDITIEVDLIEEIARVFGYNNIESVAPTAKLTMSSKKETAFSIDKAKQLLVGRGYQEAITYSFVDPKVQKALFPQYDALQLPYPISSEMSVMRVSLWPGLLQSVSYNQKRQQNRVRLFETGLRFIPDINEHSGAKQEMTLSGVIAGLKESERWDNASESVDFYDAKGDVESLLEHLGFSEVDFKLSDLECLHPGQSASIYVDQKAVGYIGAMHPQHQKLLGVNGRVFVFELFLDTLVNRQLPEASEISKFPSNRRDIAIVVDETISVGDILNHIEKIGENQLVGLNLFDIYRGEGIEANKKSLAISLILQNVTRTLEDQDIQAIVDKIVYELQNKYGATLRD
jgi:phenylalanyl-tRNA synthetase beta chain